jgi:hypothetical protein
MKSLAPDEGGSGLPFCNSPNSVVMSGWFCVAAYRIHCTAGLILYRGFAGLMDKPCCFNMAFKIIT